MFRSPSQNLFLLALTSPRTEHFFYDSSDARVISLRGAKTGRCCSCKLCQKCLVETRKESKLSQLHVTLSPYETFTNPSFFLSLETPKSIASVCHCMCFLVKDGMREESQNEIECNPTYIVQIHSLILLKIPKSLKNREHEFKSQVFTT